MAGRSCKKKTCWADGTGTPTWVREISPSSICSFMTATLLWIRTIISRLVWQWGCLTWTWIYLPDSPRAPASHLAFPLSRQTLEHSFGWAFAWGLVALSSDGVVCHYWKKMASGWNWLSSHSLSAVWLVLIWPTPGILKIDYLVQACQRCISTLQPYTTMAPELMLLSRFENVTLYPNTFPSWSRNWSSRQMSTLI